MVAQLIKNIYIKGSIGPKENLQFEKMVQCLTGSLGPEIHGIRIAI